MAGRLTESERRLALWIVLAFLAIYILPLGVRSLAVPDEARYAEVAREMITSGDWVSPHLNGVRYFEKPALGHWVDAVSLMLFGENAFAVRLPEALATGLTALLIFLFMRRFATARSGLIAAVIYLSCLEVLGVGTFAVLDPLLTLFLTGAVMAYFSFDREPDPTRGRRWLIACGAACGAAFLVKGFLAYAVPVLVIAPYLASERAWRRLALSGWLPLAVSAVVALPWAIAIHLREPDFWHYFFFVEHLQRFAAADAQHPRPSWYFLVLLPVLVFPWIYFAPVLRLSRDAGPRLTKFLWLWIVMPLAFFSLARGKLATYILPCFPPFAMLAALGFERYLPSSRTRALRVGLVILIVINGAACATVLASQAGLLSEPVYSGAEHGRELALYLAFALAIALAGTALRARARQLALSAIVAASLPIYVFATIALPARIRDVRTPEPFLEAEAGTIAPDTVLLADGDLFGVLAWYTRRTDVYLLLERGEILYGLSYPEAAHRYLDPGRLRALLAANRNTHTVVIFCTQRMAASVASFLPDSAVRRERGDFVLWRIPARNDG